MNASFFISLNLMFATKFVSENTSPYYLRYLEDKYITFIAVDFKILLPVDKYMSFFCIKL